MTIIKKKGNPGIKKTLEASTATYSKDVIPGFNGNRGYGDTDFNNLFVFDGTKSMISSPHF